MGLFDLSDEQKNEITKQVSQNLRVLRAKLNISQQDMADKIGVSRQIIYNIEKGASVGSIAKPLSWPATIALITLFISTGGIGFLVSLGIINHALLASLYGGLKGFFKNGKDDE